MVENRLLTKEITRIAAIASECSNGKIHVIVDRSLNLFYLLKSEWDKILRQEERKNTAQVGEFAAAIVESRSEIKCKN